MKKIENYEILQNNKIAKNTFKMVLKGDTSLITNSGQFINITIEDKFLKRPISICDYDKDSLTIIYKVFGEGTKWLSLQKSGKIIEALMPLGNGYTLKDTKEALLIGGGVGVPPLYNLAKKLVQKGVKVDIILGFNTKDDAFYIDEFREFDKDIKVSTIDGSIGVKGFVTDCMDERLQNLYYYTCGPLPMLKAIFNLTKASGQISFEERMGCGFGACMGCSHKTKDGYKRICKEGPVLQSEEVLW
ncbi:dihydroorotate dehydrogenase 1B, electron transfer subunit [Campylobacter blaseri]|uniref:Dihydroorotate dehydrogenase B (NAD(+)), electron transfer subunit n=1 Tax=Campylobacter blaseri TaxID=2042961 RepID=A0A2P8QZW0_9BACT|nr:dihydroorotate dehydrogenase electron transfer subunit [Campylobacter blaseri]PSM51772.1 dihydroorotate dehydrogenase electron transfer subunit [Campylobacter blaseri]PSM53563.1 dihydroorotate dehydrogenase electron transfer subunit [Campylobacter blaseri]QKF86372.1 dihydroorotate dehydrogenase 1B, electron transfer subunit [Campylobacter blaseri]